MPRSSYIYNLVLCLVLALVILSVKMLLKIPFLGGNPLVLQNIQYDDWKIFYWPSFQQSHFNWNKVFIIFSLNKTWVRNNARALETGNGDIKSEKQNIFVW